MRNVIMSNVKKYKKQNKYVKEMRYISALLYVKKIYASLFPSDKRNEMNYVYKYIEFSNKPTRTYHNVSTHPYNFIDIDTSLNPNA